MSKRRLRNNGERPKEFWGAVVGGLIGAAGSLIGSKVSGDASVESAKAQAEAIKEQTKEQGKIIREQISNDTKLFNQSQALTKQLHEEDKALQREQAMNNMFLQGQMASVDRDNAAKFKFSKGGVIGSRRKLRNAGNIKFDVTDGGGAIYRGQTPQGFDLYELFGNDHNHYHKTSNGKNKTGVGIRFHKNYGGGITSKIVEGEGNQNSSTGELLLTTPNNAYFISKHNIHGFNPAKSVKAGMNPIKAINIQESLKDIYDIPDSGSKAKYGKMCKRKLRNGGRVKLAAGGWTWGDVAGVGVSTVGNLAGAYLLQSANNKAKNYLVDAYRDRASALTDAYSQMHGIDLSTIKKEDYTPEPIIPVLQNPNYDISGRLSNVRNLSYRRRKAIKNNSLSSAAMLNRLGTADVDLQDSYGRLYEDKYNKENAVKNENVKAINAANMQYAQLKSQGLRDYTNAKLNLLQYNNNIENSKIAGIGEAKAAAIGDIGNVRAMTKQANAQGWAGAIQGIGTTIGNTFATIDKRQQDYKNSLLGASTDTKVMAAIENNDVKAMNAYRNTFESALSTATGELKNQYETFISMLDAKLDELGGIKNYKINFGTLPVNGVDIKNRYDINPRFSLKNIKPIPNLESYRYKYE